ncbi:MAG: hypothetical protein O3C39_11885 [Planctomycetota bacterium]|nr:hypothetical protein [Planctomycetota bacterium]
MSLPSVALAIAVVVALSSGVPAADLYWSDTGTWDTTPNTWGSTQGGPYNDAT